MSLLISSLSRPVRLCLRYRLFRWRARLRTEPNCIHLPDKDLRNASFMTMVWCAICGGFQLLVIHIEASGKRIEDLALWAAMRSNQIQLNRYIGDIKIHNPKRFNRKPNMVLKTTKVGPSWLGMKSPLGKVVYGNGNKKMGAKGSLQEHVFGQLLPRSILSRNTWWPID